MVNLEKCPTHPEQSGESDYGGLWCKGVGGVKCKWARKDFVNELESGETETVRKWHLPAPGKWLSQEDYILAVDAGVATEAPESPSAPTTDRDRLIVRQVCVKAACEALAMSTGDAQDKAVNILSLAGTLETWIYRE